MVIFIGLFQTVRLSKWYLHFDTSPRGEVFFFFSLPIQFILLTFAAVNKLAMTYQMNLAPQRNFDFFAFFSALYLVISDILLTHTHTHTQALLAFNHTFFLSSYARVKRAVTVVNKGFHGVSFVRFFVFICKLSKKQNKDVLSIDFTAKDTYNSLVIVCFLSLISRADGGNALSACRERMCRRLRGIDDKVIRMYIIKGEQ